MATQGPVLDSRRFSVKRTAAWAVTVSLHLLALFLLIRPSTPFEPAQASPGRFIQTAIIEHPHHRVPPPRPKPVAEKVALSRKAPTPRPFPKKQRPALNPASIVATPMTASVMRQAASTSIPQGTGNGFFIGGDGGGGGSGDGGGDRCTGDAYYLLMIKSQLQAIFMQHQKQDKRTFRVEAHIWFDDEGRAAHPQLTASTGDVALDAAILRLLGEINLQKNVPTCLQPFLVWVSEPWEDTLQHSGKHPADEDKGLPVVWSVYH